MPTSLQLWRGIFPPMVTPLTARDTLDIHGLERLIEHILGGGVQGLFILGTTGEAPSLSYKLRGELINRVCQLVRGRVPVLVGITDTAFVESVNLARAAAEAGAEALVLAPPYYFPAGQTELLEYLQHIAPELPLPVFLYNMPANTKLVFEPETVRRAMEIPNLVGLKDSSGNMIYFHHLIGLLTHRADWTLLIGPEQLLAEAVLAGGHGGICGGANICPRLYVELYQAAMAAQIEQVARLHRQVMRVAKGIYQVGRHNSAVIKGIKCALACLGICDDFMAEPFHRFRTDQRVQLTQHLQDLGITREHPCPEEGASTDTAHTEPGKE